ncbi:MAG: SUMF1/EgtB/PvdO family nonheme iron enzyme [Pyrinomonadaceae bacterium]
MRTQQNEQIARSMTDARHRTIELFNLVHERDLQRSPGEGFRPVIWHLAHIGVFESFWILQKAKGDSPPNERYQRIFDPISTPREESKNLPTRAEMEEFLIHVRDRTLDYLDGLSFETNDPLLQNAYAFHLVLEHELQHQETLAYLLHMLDPQLKKRPAHAELDFTTNPARPSAVMVTIPEGEVRMGAVWNNEFAYDNELPAHAVHVPAFKIDLLLTTNEEYRDFINEGGYGRREWWSDEGWNRKEQESWTAPFYWEQAGDGWREKRMFDEVEILPQHPVSGISWYEAEAYAKFRGKRLPSEAEWERAATCDVEQIRKRRFAWGDVEPNASRCNFDLQHWGTAPVGSFPDGATLHGCLDMSGNLWEWTNDTFAPYPGFKSFPYPEYSQEWFDGDHRVLKGGSWATSGAVLRTSFRNFFRRHSRIAFAGVRCAADV